MRCAGATSPPPRRRPRVSRRAQTVGRARASSPSGQAAPSTASSERLHQQEDQDDHSDDKGDYGDRASVHRGSPAVGKGSECAPGSSPPYRRGGTPAGSGRQAKRDSVIVEVMITEPRVLPQSFSAGLCERQEAGDRQAAGEGRLVAIGRLLSMPPVVAPAGVPLPKIDCRMPVTRVIAMLTRALGGGGQHVLAAVAVSAATPIPWAISYRHSNSRAYARAIRAVPQPNLGFSR